MKKTSVICLALASCLLTSSCIGSFNLFGKLRKWNNQIGPKFVNELVFIAFWIVPVYEVAFLADILVLNSIEFWSGSNPVTAGQKVIDGKDGKYLAKWDKTGYTITQLSTGKEMRLDFTQETKTWSLRLADGSSMELMTFVDDNHVSLPKSDGTCAVVELSQQGCLAYRQEVMEALWAQTQESL